MLATLLGKEKDDLKNDVESALTHLKVSVAQSCLTLCDPIDCSSLGSSVHGVLQSRIMEWVAISFSKEIYTRMFIGALCNSSKLEIIQVVH